MRNTRSFQVDLIRGVSIILVLFHHFNIAYSLRDTALTSVLGWEFVRAVARNGNYGVTMFFVISGYLITTNADRRWSGVGRIDAWTFYGFRVARILPCLILLLGIVNLLAVSGLTIFQNHPDGGRSLSFWIVNLASLTFWMNVLIGREGWFNYPLGVLWSLSVEEVFYVAFPILCLFLRSERRLLGFWMVMIVIGPFYRFSHQGDEGGYLYAYFASFDGIAIGCCTAMLAKRLHSGLTPLLPAAAAAGMATLYLSWPIDQTNVLGVTAMAFGTAILLLYAHSRLAHTEQNRSVALMALAWCGKLSYEFYLFHLVVLGGMRVAFPTRTTTGDIKLPLLAIFLALSAALSAAIGRLYAEPLNRGIRQRLSLGRLEVSS